MKAEAHIHAAGGRPLGDGRRSHALGYELETGDVLQETDLYASSDGYFKPCTCPGLTLQAGVKALWVRPA